MALAVAPNHASRLRRAPATPCARGVEARHAGSRLQAADADARRAFALLLRCGDRYCWDRATRLHGAYGGASRRLKFVEPPPFADLDAADRRVGKNFGKKHAHFTDTSRAGRCIPVPSCF